METERFSAARLMARAWCAGRVCVFAAAACLAAVIAAAPTAVSQTFSNTTAIAIPATGTAGVASPYPSTISVFGVGSSLAGLTVTLTGIGHGFPDDIDLLLVGPTGAAFRLWTDCGGNPDASNLTVTLSDAASMALPDATALASGTFTPSSYGAPDMFPAPAPAGTHPEAATAGTATFATVFGGTNPNGTWSLYALDDSSGDIGTIGGGWSLTITATPVELMSFDVE